jgi:hypothetical protein
LDFNTDLLVASLLLLSKSHCRAVNPVVILAKCLVILAKGLVILAKALVILAPKKIYLRAERQLGHY